MTIPVRFTQDGDRTVGVAEAMPWINGIEWVRREKTQGPDWSPVESRRYVRMCAASSAIFCIVIITGVIPGLKIPHPKTKCCRKA